MKKMSQINNQPKLWSDDELDNLNNIDYKEDKGNDNPYIYSARMKLLNTLGLQPDDILSYCKQFDYPDYIGEILLSKSDKDLYDKYPETWKFVRDTLETKTKRRRGRTCYATSKDILMDGVFTDIMVYNLKKYCPDIKVNKNEQDSNLTLNENASTEPDLIINGRRVEMKQSKDSTRWSDKTITIRPIDGELESGLFRYSKYNSFENPLYFLRINYDRCILTIVRYDDFRESFSKDGSYFARYTPYMFKHSMEDFSKVLGRAIKDKIR